MNFSRHDTSSLLRKRLPLQNYFSSTNVLVYWLMGNCFLWQDGMLCTFIQIIEKNWRSPSNVICDWFPVNHYCPKSDSFHQIGYFDFIRNILITYRINVPFSPDASSPDNWQRVVHSGFSRYAFLSDYLTDLYTGKSKKNCQKLPPVGIEPMTSGSSL